jgi:NAD(P)-dependent dehydrogenase (short-subunit alcohol dehydrogenase family)
MTKVSVITGGAGGMGLATAKIVGRDHRVLISDVNAERLEQAATALRAEGIDSEALACDITDVRSVEALASRAQELGDVGSLIHTAGVSPKMGPPELIIRVNAVGTVNVNRAFAANANAGFSIVNVASSAGHLSTGFPRPRRAYKLALTDSEAMATKLIARAKLVPAKLRPGMAYAISKNFVIWLSSHLAADLGARGARIVSVSPGSFDTEMGRLEEAHGAGQLADHAALARFGKVEEIAAVLAFCASSAPGYLTGTDILVDGGAGAKMTLRDQMAMARSV